MSGAAGCQPDVERCDHFNANLDHAAEVWHQAGGGLIRLIAHSDTFASAAESMLLSEQRAAAVRDLLVYRGVPIDQIVIEPRGEEDLGRFTPDGVVEPLNNRVVIYYRESAQLWAIRRSEAYRAEVAAATAAGIEPPPRPICP